MADDGDEDMYGDLFAAETPSGGETEAMGITGSPQPTGTVAAAFRAHDLKELCSELENFKALLTESNQQLEASQRRGADLEAERSILLRNISVLFRTATLELGRKADEIRSLRKELEVNQVAHSSQQALTLELERKADEIRHLKKELDQVKRTTNSSLGENQRVSTSLPITDSKMHASNSHAAIADRKRDRDAGGHTRTPLGRSAQAHWNHETPAAVQTDDMDRGQGQGSKRKCVEEQTLGTRSRPSRDHQYRHHSHDRTQGSNRGHS